MVAFVCSSDQVHLFRQKYQYGFLKGLYELNTFFMLKFIGDRSVPEKGTLLSYVPISAMTLIRVWNDL